VTGRVMWERSRLVGGVGHGCNDALVDASA
jgi:hypothetical protein